MNRVETNLRVTLKQALHINQVLDPAARILRVGVLVDELQSPRTGERA